MLHHWRVLALVCAFSGLVAFKPSEPFIVVFLRCVKQLSRQEIFKDVYPVLLPVLPACLRRTRAKGSPSKRLGAGVDLRVPRPPPSALRACRVRRVPVGCAARCARSVGHAGLAPRPVDQRLVASDEAAGGLHCRGLCCTSSAHGHCLPHASRRGLLPRRRLHCVRWGGRAGAHRIAHASPATAAGPLPRLHCSACSRCR